MNAHEVPSYSDIVNAARTIAPHARQTPVLQFEALDDVLGAQLFLKCENLQRIGAFKFRGACNAVFSLSDDEAAHGVATQSSGNHGAALALAARLRGIAAHVVVPDGAAQIKLDNIRAAGAQIVRCPATMAARDAATAAVIATTGAHLVHPFDDGRVIAGQGTATLELLRETGELDAVIAPLGGGGLLSGTAIAAHGQFPALRVFGAEPEGARDGHDSLVGGVRLTDRVAHTVADGLRGYLGRLAFDILREHRAEILLVDETEIISAMRLLWQTTKLIVEPSSAVAFAALIRNRERFAGQRLGMIVSGGNVDLGALPW